MFDSLGLDWNVCCTGEAFSRPDTWNLPDIEAYGDTPAIALCELLLELAPNLPKSEPEVQVIDDDGEIDEPTVIEATFG